MPPPKQNSRLLPYVRILSTHHSTLRHSPPCHAAPSSGSAERSRRTARLQRHEGVTAHFQLPNWVASGVFFGVLSSLEVAGRVSGCSGCALRQRQKRVDSLPGPSNLLLLASCPRRGALRRRLHRQVRVVNFDGARIAKIHGLNCVLGGNVLQAESLTLNSGGLSAAKRPRRAAASRGTAAGEKFKGKISI